jgi:hypothetical protein
MSEECTNPLCENPIESDKGKSWRRTPKKFCSDECKRDVWALRKAADLISVLPADKKLEVLEIVAFLRNQRETEGETQHETKEDIPRAINDYDQYGANFIRRYKCEQLPRLRIGGKVRFCQGFFETRDPALIALVERNELYGAHIVRVDTWEES